MRIELLSSPTGVGQALVDEGFPTASRNLLIPFLDQNSQSRSQENMTFTTQHEMLHLLGITHDDRLMTGANPEKRRQQNPQFLELSEEGTFESIMNIRGDELTPLMQGHNIRDNMSVTEHDIQCIRSVFRERQRIRLTDERSAPQTPNDPNSMINLFDPSSSVR